MGPANPWSPNWQPDPSGRRLATIRTARRGAFLAGVLLWPLVLLATLTTPGAIDAADLGQIVFLAALSWPGLALLGAGLAPAALGSKVDAAVAGIALGIGAPLAAILSTLIGVAIVTAWSSTGAGLGVALGATVRLGVLGAIRFAPLVALAVAIWLLAIRRSERARSVAER